MARPRKEGMDYFPHDTDASTDEKIEVLSALYGNDGYAVYFRLLERIYRSTRFELDISDEDICIVLAQKCFVPLEKFTKIVEKAVKLGLFDSDEYTQNKVLTSNGVKKRASLVEERRDRELQRIKEKRALKQDVAECEEIVAPTIPGVAPTSTQSKVKESKVKKREDQTGAAPPAHTHEEQTPCHLECDSDGLITHNGIWQAHAYLSGRTGMPPKATEDRMIPLRRKVPATTWQLVLAKSGGKDRPLNWALRVLENIAGGEDIYTATGEKGNEHGKQGNGKYRTNFGGNGEPPTDFGIPERHKDKLLRFIGDDNNEGT